MVTCDVTVLYKFSRLRTALLTNSNRNRLLFECESEGTDIVRRIVPFFSEKMRGDKRGVISHANEFCNGRHSGEDINNFARGPGPYTKWRERLFSFIPKVKAERTQMYAFNLFVDFLP